MLAALVMLSTSILVCSAYEDIAFRSPSKAIGCHFYAGHAHCEVTGSVPRPARLAGCDFGWGRGYTLGTEGRAELRCPTASAFNGAVLRYGTSRSRYGITCSSSPDRMRCTNADRRGFLISRGAAYMF